MRCNVFICAATLAFITSCVSTGREDFPKDPKDKETYTDNGGGIWIWNAAAAAWMMRSVNGGASYQYHPSTGNFTNASGFRVVPPASVSGKVTGHSGSGKAVFGSTGKGVSVSA